MIINILRLILRIRSARLDETACRRGQAEEEETLVVSEGGSGVVVASLHRDCVALSLYIIVVCLVTCCRILVDRPSSEQCMYSPYPDRGYPRILLP